MWVNGGVAVNHYLSLDLIDSKMPVKYANWEGVGFVTEARTPARRGAR